MIEAQEARWSAGAAEAAAPPGAAVTRLVLTDFRNYSKARLDLETGPVVLTGPNGAGKTNLLEAVSFLAPGRGLRGAKLTEVDRRAVDEGADSRRCRQARLGGCRHPRDASRRGAHRHRKSGDGS